MTITATGESIESSGTRRDSIARLIGLFTILWLAGAITSRGFLEDDAWAHYSYARWAWQRPDYLVNVWARPICTMLYALVAPWAGMMGCRTIGLGLVLIAAWLTWRTAEKLGIDRRAAVAFLLGQPLLFLHSLSTMTELPFAVLLSAGFLACLHRRWWLTAILVGLLPAARPEGFGFVLVLLVALVWQRRIGSIALLLAPLLIWSVAGWEISRAATDRSPWLWLIDHWPYSTQSTYGRGWLLTFVAMLPVLVGAGMPFLLVALASARMKDEGGRTKTESLPSPFSSFILHPSSFDVDAFLLLAIPLSLLVLHSLLWWTGKMASYGEIRYLLTASPFWALLAARGWQRSRAKPSPALLGAIGLLAIFVCKITVLRDTPETQTAHAVATWYRADESFRRDHPRVIASHPAVDVLLDLNPNDAAHVGAWTPDVFRHPAADAVVIWDPKCGPNNADRKLALTVSDLQKMGWATRAQFPGGWVILVKN